MTQEELNTVIEDKANEYIDGSYPLNLMTESNREQYTIARLDVSVAIRQILREALTNPTDIGLCRWVSVDNLSQIPLKKELYLRYTDLENNITCESYEFSDTKNIIGWLYWRDINLQYAKLEFLEEPIN